LDFLFGELDRSILPHHRITTGYGFSQATSSKTATAQTQVLRAAGLPTDLRLYEAWPEYSIPNPSIHDKEARCHEAFPRIFC